MKTKRMILDELQMAITWEHHLKSNPTLFNKFRIPEAEVDVKRLMAIDLTDLPDS